MKKSEKELIENEIESGNLFAWNDCDNGVLEAIRRGNGCETLEQAEQELADARGFKSVRDFDEAANSYGSYEQHHTWIYDLKEYLNEVEVDD